METNFRSGDTVKVHAKIKEGARERIQIFEGTVLGIRGRGENKTFIVRRIGAGGIGVERIWPLESTSIAKIEVVKRGDYRQSKIFFIRGLSSKQLAASSTKKS